MAARRDLRELPELEGWLSFPDAARELGISRQRLHQLAEKDPPVIETARRVGRYGVPFYVMREAEVAALKRRRALGVLEELWTG